MKVYQTKHLRNICIIGHGGYIKRHYRSQPLMLGLLTGWERLRKVQHFQIMILRRQKKYFYQYIFDTSKYKGHKMFCIGCPGTLILLGNDCNNESIDSALVLVDEVRVGWNRGLSLVKQYNVPSVIMINKMIGKR